MVAGLPHGDGAAAKGALRADERPHRANTLRTRIGACARAPLPAQPKLNPPNKEGGRSISCYDGGDQEFWRSFYRPLYELPLRYHAHTGLAMNLSEWRRIRLIHNIQGFRPVYMRLPNVVRQRVRFFHGDQGDEAKMSPSYKMR